MDKYYKPKDSNNVIVINKNEYKVIDLLGKGTYGTVYKAIPKKNPKEVVAIKQINFEKEEEAQEGLPSTALREIAILKKMDHPNIIKFFLIN
jgi:cyclin-dependent kinase